MFQNAHVITTTDISERYGLTVNNFFWPAIKAYEQDGAINHTKCLALDLLLEKVCNRVIGLSGDFKWPSISCKTPTLMRQR